MLVALTCENVGQDATCTRQAMRLVLPEEGRREGGRERERERMEEAKESARQGGTTLFPPQ